MGDDLQRRTVVNVFDFLAPIEGPLVRRFREWRLADNNAVAQLLELVEGSPDAGQPLLDLLCGVDPYEHRIHISDRLFVTCVRAGHEGERTFRFPALMWVMIFRYSESLTYNWIFEAFEVDDVAVVAFQVLHFLHKVLALDSRVSEIDFFLFANAEHQNAHFITAIRDLVSLPRSRRTVNFKFQLTPEAQRAIAFHCSPVVHLDVNLLEWHNHGEVLYEAMRANRCPKLLTVHGIFDAPDKSFAPALEATTSIEILTVYIQFGPFTEANLSAIGRNHSIRALVAMQEGPVTVDIVKAFWKAVMVSPTILMVLTNGISGEAGLHVAGAAGGARPNPPIAVEDDRDFSEGERRECAELVADLIRTNPRIVILTYHPRAHDDEIMKSRVLPILALNRIRPVVKEVLDADMDENARDRSLSALAGSPVVRNRPELLYYFLRTTANRLLDPATYG